MRGTFVIRCEGQIEVKAAQQLTGRRVAVLRCCSPTILRRNLDIKGFAALFVLSYTGSTVVAPTPTSLSVGCRGRGKEHG